jgi:hypothetical protein
MYTDEEMFTGFMISILNSIGEPIFMTKEMLDMASKGTRDIHWAERMLGRCYEAIQDGIDKMSVRPKYGATIKILDFLKELQKKVFELKDAIDQKNISLSIQLCDAACKMFGKFTPI